MDTYVIFNMCIVNEGIGLVKILALLMVQNFISRKMATSYYVENDIPLIPGIKNIFAKSEWLVMMFLFGIVIILNILFHLLESFRISDPYMVPIFFALPYFTFKFHAKKQVPDIITAFVRKKFDLMEQHCMTLLDKASTFSNTPKVRTLIDFKKNGKEIVPGKEIFLVSRKVLDDNFHIYLLYHNGWFSLMFQKSNYDNNFSFVPLHWTKFNKTPHLQVIFQEKLEKIKCNCNDCQLARCEEAEVA